MLLSLPKKGSVSWDISSPVLIDHGTKGSEAFKSKDYGIARLLYSQAMKIDPSQYIYPLNCAMASLKLERYVLRLKWPFFFILNVFRCHDAEANATAALPLAPDDLKAVYSRGLARIELRQWSLARQGNEAIKYL